MRTAFDIIEKVIKVEGGYVNHPDDKGGETNYGITIKTARSSGYVGSMRDITKETAMKIYKKQYWDIIKGDSILKLSEDVAEEVFDTSVNAGSYLAIKILQRVLNVMNNKQKYYKDIDVDGIIGKGTIAALADYLSVRKSNILVKAMNCLQGSHYITLCERKEKQEVFVYGWLTNRV